MKGNYLGEFEELVMLVCASLKEEAYGINIVEEIKKQMGRTVSLSAVHVTLYRLEDKGFVESYMGGATTTRGGRRKRIFKITNAGLQLLKSIQQGRVHFWNRIPQLKFTGD